jgi:hypothetical protein
MTFEECPAVVKKPRSLTEWERGMLTMITAVPFDGHDVLRRQIAHARVTRECGCGCLTSDFVVDPNPEYRLAYDRRGPIWDLYGKDADGMVMYTLLFLLDGYLAMLEVQRADSSPFTRPPDPVRILDPTENLSIARQTLTRDHLPPSEVEAGI